MAAPLRSVIDDEYKWAVNDIYSSDEAWNTDYEKIMNMAKEPCKYAGSIAESYEKLYQVLKEISDTDYIVERVYVYAFMKYYEDTTNSVYQEMSGKAQVAAVKSFNNALTDDDLYLYTASVEKLSEHPLAQAVVASFAKNVLPADAFKMFAGRGVEGKVNGLKITAGNEKLFAANGIIIAREIIAAAQQYSQSGCSIIYVAVNGEAAGFIALADTVRPEAADMLAGVKRAGKTTILLTGDNFNAAESVAAMVGVDEVYAGCLPEDKLNIIAGYEDKGEHICMLGDGINDAPALKKACTGIAMGGVGSDIAVDAADIVLINDDFREFGHLLELSGQMMHTIRKNIIFSLILNFTAIILAVTGLLSPVAGALVHNAGSVAVIISSALLLKWRCHNACCRKQNKKLVHCAVQ